MPPQAENQLDLADGLAGCLGDHLGRGTLVGERPDRRITLAERVRRCVRGRRGRPPDSERRSTIGCRRLGARRASRGSDASSRGTADWAAPPVRASSRTRLSVVLTSGGLPGLLGQCEPALEPSNLGGQLADTRFRSGRSSATCDARSATQASGEQAIPSSRNAAATVRTNQVSGFIVISLLGFPLTRMASCSRVSRLAARLHTPRAAARTGPRRSVHSRRTQG